MENLLSILNDAQRQAVEQIYGPVLVLAGPGTGKTHMLTTRIAHILQSNVGCEPENILCLTFTESAAVEMRNRLQSWIGPTAYRVKISTFHGFCQWVMDSYPEIFQKKIGVREVADDLVHALAYRKVIKQKKWEHFSNVWDDFMQQGDVLRAISDMKREHITPESLRAEIPKEKNRLEEDPGNFYKRKFREFKVGDFKPQAKQKIKDKISKMYELADFWELYEKELQKDGYYDFNDMINWVVNEIEENENLRFDLQEKFQWIMIDEYQDTNNAQNAIIWQLCEGIDDANVFAVGDDDQSIYRFQGASGANIIDFRERFSNRKEVVLENNYRSHQNILDTAYECVSNNLGRANSDTKLISYKKLKENEGQITKISLGSRQSEINFLVHKIKEKLSEKVAPNEIAILVRNNREIEELSRELPKFGISISAQISQNIFDNQSVRQLVLMMRIFSNHVNDEALFDLLHSDFIEIDAKTLLELSLARYKNKTTIIQELLTDKFNKPNIQKFTKFFINSRKEFHHCRPAVLSEKLLYESGLAEFLTKKDRLEDWQNIRKFIDWIRAQNQQSLPELIDIIDLNIDLDISVRPDPLPTDKNSIQIMTAHRSKGREFEIVFISGLEDRKWGNTRSGRGISLPNFTKKDVTQGDANEEERRIFFVALTRAKSQIFLSYSQTDFSGREKNPSQFWHELPENIVKEVFEEEDIEMQKILPVFLAHQEKSLTKSEKDILTQKIEKFVWSASSLQTFLDCPRKFLYQNLYKFPRRPQSNMALGVALHEALERFFHKAKIDKTFGNSGKLLEEFNYAMSGQNLPKEDFEKLKEHGEAVLMKYFEQKLQNFESQYPYGYELEYSFGQFHPDIDGIKITGKMDKIVYLDEKKKTAKIVDYKSGKPRSIKKGENYWRQLVFYDLLARKSQALDWQVSECVIEFLTVGSNGKVGERSLVVTEEDRKQVTEELKSCDEKLKNLDFPIVENPTSDSDIDYWQRF